MPAAPADRSLEQKVGQLFLLGFDGTDPPPHLDRLLGEWGLGGVVYFARNLETPTQTAALSAGLQRRAREAGLPPLFVAIDQEGGPVSRLPWGAGLPSAMALGATREEGLAFEAGDTVGGKLRSLGVNLDLAPVLDVNNNPDNPVIGVRSFGEDPGLVERLGTRFAAGLQANDVLACGKHFPGHGDTDADSHRELPVYRHGRTRLDAVELPPFRGAIEAGIDAIMTTHVAFPAVTGSEDRPATVAESVVGGLLREELGFDGLVVTDCLEMDAVADGLGTAEAAVRAVEAGCDLLTVSHTRETQLASMRAVREAVRSGRLTEARIDESVARIRAAKRDRAVGRDPAPARETASERSREVASRIAAEAVTLVRDRTGTLPLADSATVLTVAGPDGTPVADGRFDPDAFAAAVEAADCRVTHRRVNDVEGVASCGSDGAVVVGTVDAVGDDRQARAVRELSTRVEDLVVVSLRNPYDLGVFPEVDCYLTAYDNTLASLAAVGAVLRGESAPRGELPVSIPLDGG